MEMMFNNLAVGSNSKSIFQVQFVISLKLALEEVLKATLLCPYEIQRTLKKKVKKGNERKMKKKRKK